MNVLKSACAVNLPASRPAKPRKLGDPAKGGRVLDPDDAERTRQQRRPAPRTGRHHAEPGHQARWLWRTLRGAELAGLDAGQVLADAIGERNLAGARDLPSVIDARIRYQLSSLVPLPAGPWTAQVPAIADPERRAYTAQIAAMMDARKDRIGQHAAEHALPWAVAALGPVPEHPLDRVDWQNRAASVGAWRELSGYHHPAEPIGPEPAAAAPDMRAAWHEAVAALCPAGGPDVRGMPDGRLLHLRDTYPIETAWSPQWVGDELRQVRAAAWNARLAATRASAEAKAFGDRGHHDSAARHQELGDSYQAAGSIEPAHPVAGITSDKRRCAAACGRDPAAPARSRRRDDPPLLAGCVCSSGHIRRTRPHHLRDGRRHQRRHSRAEQGV